MELIDAVKLRHSVRQYKDLPINGDILVQLQNEINACNKEGDLHIQLVTDEPKAFGCAMARYGSFKNVSNYFALVGKKGRDLSERCGYFGERLVLRAQQLGLNTCWVAATFSKTPGAFSVAEEEKLAAVIAVGYGLTDGAPRKSKSIEDVSNCTDSSPEWFKNGVSAALLAPTAVNQQKFYITLKGDAVTAKAKMGFYSNMDLGIVKYNFEIGAGKEIFKWKRNF